LDKETKNSQKDTFKPDKKGFDMREHMSLRIDAIEAEKHQERMARGTLKNSTSISKTLPIGLQKLKKKVREVYDEDDEDEDDYNHTFLQMPTIEYEEENRLLFGLSDDEKRALKIKETNDVVRSQQNAGKMEALHIAHMMARDVGLEGLSKKSVADGMQDALFEPQKIQEKAVKKEISDKLGVKGKIEDGKIIQAARGIKKIENLGGQKAAKNLDMKDVIKAGEQKLDEIKLAEMILKKSGQDVKKRKQKLSQSKDKLELKNLENQQKKDEKKQKRPKMIEKNNDFSR